MWQIINETVAEFFPILAESDVMLLYETELVDLRINDVIDQLQIDTCVYGKIIRKLDFFALLKHGEDSNIDHIVSNDVALFLSEGNVEVSEPQHDFNRHVGAGDSLEKRELYTQRAGREIFVSPPPGV